MQLCCHQQFKLWHHIDGRVLNEGLYTHSIQDQKHSNNKQPSQGRSLSPYGSYFVSVFIYGSVTQKRNPYETDL